MLKKHSSLFSFALKTFDIVLIQFAFFLAHYSVYSKKVTFTDEVTFYLCFHIVIWLIFSSKFRIYNSKRTENLLNEFIEISKTISISVITSVFFLLFIYSNVLSREMVTIFWLLHLSFIILSRFLIRITLRTLRISGLNYRNLLIVGLNDRTYNILEKIYNHKEFGLKLVGIVDNKSSINSNITNSSFFKQISNKIIGNLDQIEEILNSSVIDEVYITLPIKSFYAKIENIFKMCEEQGIEVRLLPDIFQTKIARKKIELIDDLLVIKYSSGPYDKLQLFFKRIIDLTMSIIFLIILSPLFFLIGLVIKFSSDGPIFYKQPRLGYHKRKFTIFKFRTMIKNADKIKTKILHLNEAEGPTFKMSNDPRVTPVGKFLRKFSLDELPQLLNILSGDMSLVGPRPPLPAEVKKYKRLQKRRLSMKPGLTGMWQVYGRYKIDFDKWVKLDLQYIDNWSLLLDLRILFKTIPIIIKGEGV